MQQPDNGDLSALGSVERLTRVVRETLAQRCRLRPESVRLQCLPIHRGGEVCGLHFALRGPRDVLLTAVWDASTATLWCYDSRGERFLCVPATGSEEEMFDPTNQP